MSFELSNFPRGPARIERQKNRGEVRADSAPRQSSFNVRGLKEIRLRPRSSGALGRLRCVFVKEPRDTRPCGKTTGGYSPRLNSVPLPSIGAE